MGQLTYNFRQLDIDEHIFYHNADWKAFYGDIKEELLPSVTCLNCRDIW
jgi:hypothetical protein